MNLENKHSPKKRMKIILAIFLMIIFIYLPGMILFNHIKRIHRHLKKLPYRIEKASSYDFLQNEKTNFSKDLKKFTNQKLIVDVKTIKIDDVKLLPPHRVYKEVDYHFYGGEKGSV